MPPSKPRAMEASASSAAADTSRPHRRSARARREQRQRAAARVVGAIVKASSLLASHRGCSPGVHLGELASLLGGRPLQQDIPQAIPQSLGVRSVGFSADVFSDAEVAVGDGEVDSVIPPVVISGDAEMDVGIPPVMISNEDMPVQEGAGMPRQSVPQLVQLFEQQTFRNDGHAATPHVSIPHRFPMIPEEEVEGIPPAAFVDTSDLLDDIDHAAGAAAADDDMPLVEEDPDDLLSASNRRAFDDKMASIAAALDASYREDPD